MATRREKERGGGSTSRKEEEALVTSPRAHARGTSTATPPASHSLPPSFPAVHLLFLFSSREGGGGKQARKKATRTSLPYFSYSIHQIDDLSL